MSAIEQVTSGPILVLDSGVGGLSVHAHIRSRLPQVPTIYLADSAGFPYGTKSEQDVLQRVVSLAQAVHQVYLPSLVVIACNTASTIVLPELRARLQVPIVGVVPAIKTAAAVSQTRQIGLLATPGTVAREYTGRLIEHFASDCEVVRVGSHALVHMAEAYLQGNSPDLNQLREILSPFFESGRAVDAIVLGCTHFPLLASQLAQAAPYPVQWVDSGEAIARRVAFLLEGQEPGKQVLFSPQGGDAKALRHLALFTRPCDERMEQGILRRGFDAVGFFEHAPIDLAQLG